jgi:hypothetical protein
VDQDQGLRDALERLVNRHPEAILCRHCAGRARA